MGNVFLKLLAAVVVIALAVSIALISATKAKAQPVTQHEAIVQAGVKMALSIKCRQESDKVRAKCRRRRAPKYRKTVEIIVQETFAAGAPAWTSLAFVATSTNEAGLSARPSCGAVEPSCVKKCDDTTRRRRDRQGCYIDCARDQGITGRARLRRIRRCNDAGSSRGLFQLKPRSIRLARSRFGADFDPHDLRAAARFYVDWVKRTARTVHRHCGRVSNRWAVALKRVGAGPRYKIQKATKGQWVVDVYADSGKRWIPRQKARYAQRCTESAYAGWGLAAWRKCKRCRVKSTAAR